MSNESDALKAHFIREWTKRLYLEYDDILYRYQIKLLQPLIKVIDHASIWGCWQQHLRTITISTRLIEMHSWDIVVEVLKHEIAHQYVSEKHGISDATHGDRFLNACRKLGVADWAVKASGELPEEITSWKFHSPSPEDERLIKRAEKLLALAGSSNENEALLAMQRVRELYAKFNIDQVKSGHREEMVYLMITRRQKRINRVDSSIFSIISGYFFVKVIFLQQFDPKDLCCYSTAEVLGTRQNVLMAEYVYHFLWNQSHALWRDFQKKTKVPGRQKMSFLLGVLNGFEKKLKSQNPLQNVDISSEEERALLVQTDALLDAWVGQRHPKLRTSTQRGVALDKKSFLAGHSEGERLTLNRPITRNDGNRGGLLN